MSDTGSDNIELAASVAPTGVIGARGWLKKLEGLARGRWAWRLCFFELQPSTRLLVYSASERAAPLGMMPLQLASRAAWARAQHADRLEIVLQLSDEEVRLRAATPEVAAAWLEVLKSAIAVCQAGVLPPPVELPSPQSGLEAAALTADDPAPFPHEAACLPTGPHAAAAADGSPNDALDRLSPGRGRSRQATVESIRPVPQPLSPESERHPARSRSPTCSSVSGDRYTRQAEYGGRFGENPWPTAPTHMDRRPSHARYSYSPQISPCAERLYKCHANSEARAPASERLYQHGMRRLSQQESRGAERIDRAAFDYPIVAGLEQDGIRGDKPIFHRPAVSAAREAIELQGATFAPQLDERTIKIVSEAQMREKGQVFDNLYAKAQTKREDHQRMLEEKAQRELEGLTFEPSISSKSQQLRRSGYVEDRLIAGWAEGLLLREELALRAIEAEEARVERESEGARQHDSTISLELRRKLKAAHAATPVHERLYRTAEEWRQKADAKSSAPPTPSDRWDGSALPDGSPRLSLRSSRGRANSTSPPPSRAGAAPSPSLHDRLHQQGMEELRREKQREDEWKAVVSHRLGAVGATAPKPPKPPKAEGERQSAASCGSSPFDRLYQEGMAHHERRASATPPADESRRKSVARSAAAATAHGKAMYADAMARMQQREQLMLQVQQEQDELAREQAHLTVASGRLSSQASERLYMGALERQARAERRLVMRLEEVEAAEVEGATFQPEISQRARHLSTSSSVEERTKQWWEMSRSRRASQTAESPHTPKPASGSSYNTIQTR
ncbi:hypothetical protein AB1Y20_023527 [Prymnesium parvum]|uniref:PH domain-containing protein n=1 Tax=Prymnesium parvum TaxID=97485 RepID=A0AB34JFP3_PRYPA